MRGRLPGSHWDWQSGADFRFSKWQSEEGAEEASSQPGEASSDPEDAPAESAPARMGGACQLDGVRAFTHTAVSGA